MVWVSQRPYECKTYLFIWKFSKTVILGSFTERKIIFLNLLGMKYRVYSWFSTSIKLRTVAIQVRTSGLTHPV